MSEDLLSRRTLLQGAAAALPLGRAHAAPTGTMPTLAFIGGYAPKSGGIQAVAQQGARLRPLHLTPNPHNPSWLVAPPSGHHLYAVNEQDDFQERRSGSVSSYAITPANGELQLLTSVPSGGAGPVHLSLHPAGRHAFVAHYGSGHVAVLPLAEDGRLSAPSQILPPLPGPASHAHMAQADPSGRFVLVTDLGLDRVTVWRFDTARGLLGEPQTQALAAGSGPRHLVFHPQQPQQVYLLNEKDSTLVWFGFDADIGRLTPRATLSSLPPGFAGRNYAADLRFSPDGRHLYCLNRLHDSIAIFAIAADGCPRWQGEEGARGAYPRACAFDPAGEHLYVCNQRSDQISVFRRDSDGGLRFTGDTLSTGSPAVIAFVGALK